MSLLFLLAWRNLVRNARRTVLTGVAVSFGVAFTILGYGLVSGLDENAIRSAEGSVVGNVLLRPEGYPIDGLDFPLDEAEAPSPALIAALDAAVAGGGAWTARTAFPGRLVKGADAAQVRGWAYDPVKDPQVFPRDAWAADGAWPDPAAATPQIAVGKGLARLLGVARGDIVTFQLRTRDGAQNALQFEVSAIVSTDNAGLDNVGVWVPLSSADGLVSLGGARTHVAVRLPGGRAAAPAAAAALATHGWTARPILDEVADVLALNNIRRKSLVMIVGIVMAIGAAGIANTVIMSVFERVREIGTLMAMGLRRAQIRAMFLIEGLLLGVGAGGVGALLGGAATWWWQEEGIHLGDEVTARAGEIAIGATLYARLEPGAVLGAFLFGVAVAVVASIWPAGHAASLNPADAVRAE